jgi:hypothetical protein
MRVITAPSHPGSGGAVNGVHRVRLAQRRGEERLLRRRQLIGRKRALGDIADLEQVPGVIDARIPSESGEVNKAPERT